MSTTERTYGTTDRSRTPSIESLEFADLSGHFVSSIEDDPAGGLRAMYYDDEGNPNYLPYDEAVANTQEIEVGAIAETRPVCVDSSGTLQLILPSSAIGLSANSGYLRASMSFDTGVMPHSPQMSRSRRGHR